jgi:hypothetical protein
LTRFFTGQVAIRLGKVNLKERGRQKNKILQFGVQECELLRLVAFIRERIVIYSRTATSARMGYLRDGQRSIFQKT